MSRRSVSGAAGFTLLEVLAALAVLGLLMVALGQGVRFGTRAWQAQVARVGAADGLAPLDQALRGMIARTIDPTAIQGRGPIVGEAHRLDIVTDLPPRPDGLAIHEAHALLEVDAAHRLVLLATPSAHVQWFRPPPEQEIVLAEHIEAIDIAYWQEAPGGAGGGAWVGAWRVNTLPALVRLRLVFPPGDPRRWPDIVAAPRRGPLASCELLFAARANRPIACGAVGVARRNVG